MGPHIHYLTKRRIRQLFVSGLSTNRRAKLLKEVTQCPKCAKIYQTYHNLEIALTGESHTSHFARSRTRSALLETIPDERPTHSVMQYRWAFAGTLTAVAMSLLLILLPSAPADHRTSISPDATLSPIHILNAKGSKHDDISDIGFRVFQVNQSGTQVREAPNLKTTDILTFTYTYAKPTTGYLTLFGIQESGDIRWYYPDYQEKRSIEVNGDRVDEPLKDGIDLSINHTPGWLRIVAIFSEQPIDIDSIEESVLKSPVRRTMKDMNPIIITNTNENMLQYSVMINISNGQ